MELKEKFGNYYLHHKLKKIDPISADKLNPNNWQRIIRALEVYFFKLKPIWQF